MSQIIFDGQTQNGDVSFRIQLKDGMEQRCIIDKDVLQQVLTMTSSRERQGEVTTQHELHESSQSILMAVSEAMRHNPSARGPLRLESKHFALVDNDQAPAL